ncbi:hypothetical protein GCM10010423_68160 [Streptomyces levis]|uniref:Uncharacterized protein n=1 Tax=Streptomyces levis TaxID=285566 RepID=A0ABN3P2L9_9ACTN
MDRGSPGSSDVEKTPLPDDLDEKAAHARRMRSLWDEFKPVDRLHPWAAGRRLVGEGDGIPWCARKFDDRGGTGAVGRGGPVGAETSSRRNGLPPDSDAQERLDRETKPCGVALPGIGIASLHGSENCDRLHR